MMPKQTTIQAMRVAIKGGRILLGERSIQLQCAAGLLMSIVGYTVGLSPLEWAIQTLAIGLVISIEGLNTAIEHLADFVEPEFNPAIGRLKDIAAGAVFLAAVSVFIVALLIYVPKMM